MNIIIKNGCEDLRITSPLTGKDLIVRFIPQNEYYLYFDLYPNIFEIEIEIEEK